MVAFSEAADNKGADFFSDLNGNTAGGTESQVSISSVTLRDSTGALLGTVTNSGASGDVKFAAGAGFFTDTSLSVTFHNSSGGTAEVDGLLTNYRVEFRTGSTTIDRFTIENISSNKNISFDVGNISALDIAHSSAEADLNVAFEDDGPTAQCPQPQYRNDRRPCRQGKAARLLAVGAAVLE